MTAASAEPHPATGLQELVHQRTRLGMLTVLAEAGRADFTYLRDTLELTDGNLSRHLQLLAAEHLVDIEKGYEENRPRTWVALTAAGRAALEEQVAAMKDLVARVERTLHPGRRGRASGSPSSGSGARRSRR